MEEEKKYDDAATDRLTDTENNEQAQEQPVYTSSAFSSAYKESREEPSAQPVWAAQDSQTAEEETMARMVETEPAGEDCAQAEQVAESGDVSAPVIVQEAVYAENKKSKRPAGFFVRNKGMIATGVICSLLGGIIGGGIASSVWDKNALAAQQSNGNQSYSAFPINQTTPVQISGDAAAISPGVAIAKAVTPAIVGITNKATVRNYFGQVGETAVGTGSGVIFREDGYIITNYHVIEGATSLSVSLADGRIVDGTIVGADATTDIAVVKIDADNLTAAVLGDSDQLEVGELAIAIGNPLGEEFARTVTEGIISGTNRTIQAEDRTYTVIQTDAAINSGNSGGALVNSKGEVIGINSVKIQSNGVEGMGFAIPINEVKPIVQELMDNGYVSRPYMGITGMTLTNQVVQYYRLNPQVSQGVLVYSTVAGSPAQQAGIQPGDVLYKVDSTVLESMEQLTEYLADHKAGDKLTFLVDRSGKSIEATVTLGDQGKAEQEQQAKQQSSGYSNGSNGNSYSFTLPW